MLLGLAGGVSAMYFVFEYEGYEPHIFIGTRNHEDNISAACNRLGITLEVRETTSSHKAAENLTAALGAGHPAIVWANMYVLPHNAMPPFDFPAMSPIVVYGYDTGSDKVYLADRAHSPLEATASDLAEARAAQGSLKHRLITFGAVSDADLRGAARQAIGSCAALLLDGPADLPRFRSNFGLGALEKWARLVADEKDKKGWAKIFPRGSALYSVLLLGYEQIELWGTGGSAARPMYADFLEEVAPILGVPALNDASTLFRESGKRWSELAAAMLPAHAPQLREALDLTLKKHKLFTEGGMATVKERRRIAERLTALKAEASADFPMSESEVRALREELRERILDVHEAEKEAASALRSAVG
jgi:hypothetical protein